jgi:AsmA protein
MKALRIAGGVLIALLVLASIGVAYVVGQFDAPRIKAELAKAVQEKKQRTLRIDGDLKLALWPRIALDAGKLSLSEHQSDKEFAAIDSARISVALLPLLSKRIVVDAVEISGVRATLVKHKDGTLNIADLLTSDTAESDPVQLDIAGMRIADVHLVWRDEQTGAGTTLSGLELAAGPIRIDTGRKSFDIDGLALSLKERSASRTGADSFEFRLDAPKLAITPEKSVGETVTLSATLAAPQKTLAAKLVLSGIAASAHAATVAGVALDLDAKIAEASVNGRLESPLAIDLDKQTLALDKIAGAFDIAHPHVPAKRIKLPLEGALLADLAKSSAHGRLGARFDESKIALKFTVPKFAPLSLGFDLDIDTLNLDRYLPQKKEGGKNAEGDGKPDFSALNDLNINGTVRIGTLQVANIKAGNLKLRIRAAAGRLDIAPVSMKLDGGTLDSLTAGTASRLVGAVKRKTVGTAVFGK